MNDLLTFTLVGITTGTLYGLAAVGLVLTYKTSGIFNFAHGAIAALAAYAFYDLYARHGVPLPLALLLSIIVLPPIIAVLLERIARRLSRGPTTAKIAATVGLQLAITGLLMIRYGAETLQFPTFLPATSLHVLGVNLGLDQVISALVASAGVAALFTFFRRSRLGLQMRAVVDDPDLLELAGTGAFRVRSWAWLIGCWFAAISGVLLAPYIGLDALLLTLLVVQAFGAAAVGYFSSLPLTFGGGILVGVLASLSTRYLGGSTLLSGLAPSIPFLVLFAVLLIVPKGRLVEVSSKAPPQFEARRPRHRVVGRVSGSIAVSLAVVVPLFVGTKLSVYSNGLVFVLVFQSLMLLVNTSGQVSLSQAAFVALGASTFAHAAHAGMPWLLAVLIAGLVTVPLGAVISIPAMRLSGLFLALATLGFGLLMERILYRSPLMFGTEANLSAPRPAGLASDTRFYYVLLAFVVCSSLGMTVIRRCRLGRLLRAMADAPTALATLGLAVNITRVTVFCLAAFLAGIGGALFAAQSTSVNSQPFSAFASLTWLAVLFMSSSGRQAAPVLAALGLTIVPAYVTDATLQSWFPVMFGLGALAVATRQSGQAGRTASLGTRAAPSLPSSGRITARRAGVSPVRDRHRTASTPTDPLFARLVVSTSARNSSS